MKLFILVFAILSASLVFAGPASYETQLIKLAKALKGEPASLLERQELQTAVAQGQGDAYLQRKTQEYLADAKFSLKLKQKVDELVRLVPQTAEGVFKPNDFGNGVTPGISAYDFLVRNMIVQNTSWDTLLTGKTYQTYGGSGGFLNELSFYSLFDPTYKEPTGFDDVFTDPLKPHPLFTFSFDKNDPRFAGILTTPRFFDRYVNTALNKNRRRAAAVFRIFLCDTMIPTVPAQDSNSEKGDYDIIVPGHKNPTEDDLRRSLLGNIHGQQADCMSCHYKLDPLGQTFAFSPVTAAIHPSPGALRFMGDDGRKVDIAVSGLAELGEKIIQQPEYEKCQVENFWRWYIGKDVPLVNARETQLVQAFNQVGRRPKDFVTFLVSLPEFKEKPQVLTEDQLLARRVVKVFKNCNSCHESQGESVWDLTDLPYGTDPLGREKRINLLKKVMDIDHNGLNPSMPPKDSLWKPSQDEFVMIKKWMDRGSPDFQGNPQVSVPPAPVVPTGDIQ